MAGGADAAGGAEPDWLVKNRAITMTPMNTKAISAKSHSPQ